MKWTRNKFLILKKQFKDDFLKCRCLIYKMAFLTIFINYINMILIKRARLVRLSIIFTLNNNKYNLGNVFVKRNRSVYWNIESMISKYRVTYCKNINVFFDVWICGKHHTNMTMYAWWWGLQTGATDDSEAQVYCKYSILSRRSIVYCLNFL